MNLRHIEAFQAIMSSGSTIGAGERLGLSQSAVSRMLAQLEEDLGLRLFVREKGRLLPTPEADALLQGAMRLVDSAQGFRRHSQQLRLGGFSRKLLKVALPHTLATEMMPGLARRFMAQHPDVVLEVLSVSYSDAARAVLGRDADLAFVRLPLDLPGLKVVATLETDAVCIMPPGHRLERLEQVQPLDLEEEPLVLMGRQRDMRSVIDMAFRQARVLPRVAAEVHSVAVACSFVAAGAGVSVVNALVASYCQRLPLVTRPFKPTISFQRGLATLEESTSPSCNALVAMILDSITQEAIGQGHTRLVPA